MSAAEPAAAAAVSSLPGVQWLTAPPADSEFTVVLLFQVNCPGCLLFALPALVALGGLVAGRSVSRVAVATAFEDFELNTQANAAALLEHGRLVGESLKAMRAQKPRELFDVSSEAYSLDWSDLSVGTDELVPFSAAAGASDADRARATEILVAGLVAQSKGRLPVEALRAHVASMPPGALPSKVARTFWTHGANGTPTWIVLDRGGRVLFSCTGHVDPADLARQLR
eukprot:Amastigsp_a12999_18.p1 type:complete len:227 gc:universal Amastigsp_a12999_18:805-125(-)